MSMDVGGSHGGVKSDINVTPLVDVMLVLLIIMMLVAPMLQKGVDVRLPSATNTTDKPETSDQTVIAIGADRRVYINAVQVRPAELIAKVTDAFETKKAKLIVIKADEDVDYGTVMDTMDALSKAGAEDMGLITEKKVRAGQAGGE